MRYAQNTSVPVDRSRMEIERTLTRYGAHAFAYASEAERAMITFKMQNRVIRFILTLPPMSEFSKTPGRGRDRNEQDTYKHWEQACRQRWRALALVIKAKLEYVAGGDVKLEEEFLANIVVPDSRGQTVGDILIPQLSDIYKTGKMPKLLGA